MLRCVLNRRGSAEDVQIHQNVRVSKQTIVICAVACSVGLKPGANVVSFSSLPSTSCLIFSSSSKSSSKFLSPCFSHCLSFLTSSSVRAFYQPLSFVLLLSEPLLDWKELFHSSSVEKNNKKTTPQIQSGLTVCLPPQAEAGDTGFSFHVFLSVESRGSTSFSIFISHF